MAGTARPEPKVFPAPGVAVISWSTGMPSMSPSRMASRMTVAALSVETILRGSEPQS